MGVDEMSEVINSRIEMLEKLLKEVSDAAYSVILESNGLSDNDWKTPDGVLVPEFPVKGYWKRLERLSKAQQNAQAYFKPAEAEKLAKWSAACSTASYVVDRYKQEIAEGNTPQNLVLSSLHRNIADAIHGTLLCTPEQRLAGERPRTMGDRLDELVATGKLVAVNPLPPPRNEGP